MNVIGTGVVDEGDLIVLSMGSVEVRILRKGTIGQEKTWVKVTILG